MIRSCCVEFLKKINKNVKFEHFLKNVHGFDLLASAHDHQLAPRGLQIAKIVIHAY